MLLRQSAIPYEHLPETKLHLVQKALKRVIGFWWGLWSLGLITVSVGVVCWFGAKVHQDYWCETQI